MNNLFLILGIVFLTIAVIGQSKLLFLEINPGCFGRLLALIIGVLSLSVGLPHALIGTPNLDLFTNVWQNIIPEFTNLVKQVKLFD